MVQSGYLVHQDKFIFEMTKLRPLALGTKMCAAHNNDLNLPITSPNLNIFQYD